MMLFNMPNKIKKKKLSFVQERKPFERERKHQHLYNSWKWKKRRKLFLEKNPLCVHCASLGLITSGKVVDHIVRYKEGDDFFEESNWQVLCEMHHNKKSAKESRGMGSKHYG